ncbi:MAG: hypothetical protein AAFV07_02745, partial [Bacteroidota bacterium]
MSTSKKQDIITCLRHLIWCLLSLCGSVSLFGQWQVSGQMSAAGKTDLQTRMALVTSPDLARQQVVQWLDERRLAGYLAASLDTLIGQGDSGQVEVYEGPLHLWESLNFGEVAPLALQRVGLDRWKRRHPLVNWQELEAALKECLDWYQNEGFPFAAFEQEDLTL